MADKKISELDVALQINNDAVFPMSQDNAGEPTSFKTPITQLGTKIAEGLTFSNLQTQNKNLVGAINELLSLGSPIIIGTTAPTSSIGADGNLYVQYTEGTGGADDEVDGIYAKIDGAWCEIETGGGGGSGGHTIVDNSGTALTQRTNLQFNGAYSEDNATDDTTEIDVVREMTKAEFDELTEAEKTGLINITDITGGNDDRFQPVIYSTDEREIGVWTDGKPLYQKTTTLTNIMIALSGGYSYDISSWNVDTIVKNPEGFITVSNDTDLRTVPFGVLGNYATDITSTKSEIKFSRKGGDLTCNRVVFTLTYTKTTDTAGSGQWTPQGVPAVHYSEDEQVVGTWVDGSTVYEKTIIFLNQALQGGDTVLSLGVTNIDIVVESNALITNSAHTNIRPINSWHLDSASSQMWYRITPSSGELMIHAESSWETPNIYVTIRYTKSV